MNEDLELHSNSEEVFDQYLLDRAVNGSEVISASPPESSSQEASQPNVKKKLQRRHSVWAYFDYYADADLAKCKIEGCDKSYKGPFSTNLLKHLRSKHPDKHQVVQLKQTSIKRIKGVRKTRHKYSRNDPRQRIFRRSVAKWVAVNCTIPRNVVNQQEFQEMMESANASLSTPSRSSLDSEISKLKSEVMKKIKDKIAKTSRISLSCDIWTKRGMASSYLGVLATFFDEGAKTVVLLDVKRIESTTHKASDILREMNAVIQSCAIDPRKVWFTMTDSASNMIAAFKTDWSISKDGDGEEFEEVEHEYIEDISSDSENTRIYHRYSCFIHTLLLSVKLFEKETYFQNILRKVKSLVQKFSLSQFLTGELKRRTKLKLLQFSATRWNVIFLVLDRLLKVQIDVGNILRQNGDDALELSIEEWETIRKIRSFLEPFHRRTVMSSSDTGIYFSEGVMILQELTEHLEEYSESSHEGFQSAAKTILSDLKRRFSTHVVDHDLERNTVKISRVPMVLYTAATLLDPRYKDILEGNEVAQAKRFIISCCNSDSFSVPEGQALPEVAGRKSKYNVKKRSKRPREANSQQLSPVELELNEYLKNVLYEIHSQQDPLDFWVSHKSTFPILWSLACDLLCLPLNTAPVESTFASAAISTFGRRNGLEGEHLGEEIVLTRNKFLVE